MFWVKERGFKKKKKKCILISQKQAITMVGTICDQKNMVLDGEIFNNR